MSDISRSIRREQARTPPASGVSVEINQPGAQNVRLWGWLTYDGQKLPRGNVNDYYLTPWGPMYWVDVPKASSGLHGFMPIPLPQNPRSASRPSEDGAHPGHALALPASLAGAASGKGDSPVSADQNSDRLYARSQSTNAGDQSFAQRAACAAARRQRGHHPPARQSRQRLSMASRRDELAIAADDGSPAVFAASFHGRRSRVDGHLHLRLSSG